MFVYIHIVLYIYLKGFAPCRRPLLSTGGWWPYDVRYYFICDVWEVSGTAFGDICEVPEVLSRALDDLCVSRGSLGGPRLIFH